MCLHCVFNTIHGPGKELQVDDEIFMSHLVQLLPQLFFTETVDWYSVFECMELILLKQRETRANYVLVLVRYLLQQQQVYHLILLYYNQIMMKRILLKILL